MGVVVGSRGPEGRKAAAMPTGTTWGRLETRPKPERYKIVMKDVGLRKYGIMGFGRHEGFISKLKMVLLGKSLKETERAVLWTLLLEWVPLVQVFQGDVPFDGIGGLGEDLSVGVLDTTGWHGRAIRFEWLKITGYKGLVCLTDVDEQ